MNFGNLFTSYLSEAGVYTFELDLQPHPEASRATTFGRARHRIDLVARGTTPHHCSKQQGLSYFASGIYGL
jgi:hypothetical protein